METPKKLDQRYISEPTVGTDQEQFEDVARAQAAAWRKPDAAELIRDNFVPRRGLAARARLDFLVVERLHFFNVIRG